MHVRIVVNPSCLGASTYERYRRLVRRAVLHPWTKRLVEATAPASKRSTFVMLDDPAYLKEHPISRPRQ